MLVISSPARAQRRFHPKGPDELPESLSGMWKITLCIHGNHSWLRLQSLKTKEVHTLSRYAIGLGESRDNAGRLVTPAVVTSGVQWDQDIFHEHVDRDSWAPLLSLVVSEPIVYRGKGDGYGYNAVTNNCASYVRDAWVFYGGGRYKMSVPHLPGDLRDRLLVVTRN